MVDDPLPGGFIVVNTDFSTERKDLVEKLKKMRQDDNKNNYYFADTFDHWEIYEDKVTLFANSLSAGEHNFTYLIRAQYFGTYNLPATKAEQMYEPEVFGYSRKELIEIK